MVSATKVQLEAFNCMWEHTYLTPVNILGTFFAGLQRKNEDKNLKLAKMCNGKLSRKFQLAEIATDKNTAISLQSFYSILMPHMAQILVSDTHGFRKAWFLLSCLYISYRHFFQRSRSFRLFFCFFVHKWTLKEP